jgi:hypothetical protein
MKTPTRPIKAHRGAGPMVQYPYHAHTLRQIEARITMAERMFSGLCRLLFPALFHSVGPQRSSQHENSCHHHPHVRYARFLFECQ